MIVAKNFLELVDDGFIFAEIFQVAFAQRLDADLIGAGLVVKDNIAQKFFLVTFAPNFETFGDGVRVAINFFAAKDACRLKFQFAVEVGGIKHEPLTAVFLLPIGKELPAVLFHVGEFVLVFRAESFAFDYKNDFAVLRNANICAAALLRVTELPIFFKLNVFGLVALIEQTIDAFKDDEIFFVGFVEEIISVASFDLRGIRKFFRVKVGTHDDAVGKSFFKKITALGEVHGFECSRKIFFREQVISSLS